MNRTLPPTLAVHIAPKTTDPAGPRRILRLPHVQSLTGLGRSQIYLLMGNGQFPLSKKLGARAVGWDSTEIERWVSEKLDA